MSITTYLFGKTALTGENVYAHTMQNTAGMRVTVIDYGGAVQSLFVPDRNGVFCDVVCGYDGLSDYEQGDGYLGALVGRWANRIAKGSFSLDGVSYKLAKNNGENHLHGGNIGYSHRVWHYSEEGENTVLYTLNSADGEEGYPGTLQIGVTYQLTEDNTFSISYHAETDRKTVINLTNHTYFNLRGFASGKIEKQCLWLDADAYLPTDSGLIPTGEIRSVLGTPFDFTREKEIGKDFVLSDPDLKLAGGYDHCFCFRGGEQREPILRGRVRDPYSGRVMELYTDQPCVQFYTANFLTNVAHPLKGGFPQGAQNAFCLETERMPDSMNHAGFTACTVEPGKPYTHKTAYRFCVSKESEF